MSTHDTLREQLEQAIRHADAMHPKAMDYMPLADAALAVLAERERVLRERIEALGHPNDSLRRAEALADVRAVLDGWVDSSAPRSEEP